jgi:predicted permease
MTQNADGLWMSGDFFRALGLRPAAGRLLSTADDRRGCAALAVLSYGFWRSHYGAAGNAIGSTISLDGHPYEVIGVAPAGFYGMTVGRKFDIAVPICDAEVFDGPKESRLDNRHWLWLHVAGRIRTGIGMARLKSRLAALSPAVYGSAVPGYLDSTAQDNFRKRVMMPLPLATGLSDLRKDYEKPLRVLMAVVGLVLLIACANIASLVMARAAARGKEMAMRLALGASRLRLMRQLMAECLLLSFAGAALGLALAHWGDALLLNYLSGVHRQVFLDFALDARVLIFTAGAATITGLLFGVAPALRGTLVSLSSAVKENHATAGGPCTRLRLWIVASQVALSLVLLVSAGLLLRSFRNLATADVGFNPEHVLLVNVNLFTAKTPPSEYTATYDRIGAQLRALPGVVSAARSMLTPLGNSQWNTDIHSDVPHPIVGENGNQVYFNFVDRYYFATLRTPLLTGRDFNSSDSAKSQPVAVINQTLARIFFPGVNPIGHTFRPEGPARKLLPAVEVIGVTRDAKYESMREEPVPTVFCPLAQTPLEDPADSFEVRVARPQRAMGKAIEDAVAIINPGIPIEIRTLMTQVDESMTRERLLAALSAFFGGLALLLATIGVYGTLSYLVARRRIEFGVRMALGATSRSILTLVMRNVATLLIGGIVTGMGLSLATSRLLSALLIGIKARDPGTIAMSGALIAAASLAAGLLAARRATRVDPMVALREE